MEKFLNIIISVLILFLTFVGVICIFVLFSMNFALCLPIIIVSFLFLKTKNK